MLGARGRVGIRQGVRAAAALGRLLSAACAVLGAGKVVDRHWYNRNKHIFPASNWAVYDPDKAVQGKDDNALPPGAR